MVKVSHEDEAWSKGTATTPLRPSIRPSFLRTVQGYWSNPRAQRVRRGFAHAGMWVCAPRARVFPIACSFLGLVKHNGTNWGKRVVGGVGLQNIQPGNSITQAPRTSSKPVTYLPTYTRYLLFLSLLALRLPVRGDHAAWRSVKATSLGAHIGPSPNDGSRSAVRAGSTTPRSIEGRCPPAPLATSGCSRATSKCHPPQMARHLPVQ